MHVKSFEILTQQLMYTFTTSLESHKLIQSVKKLYISFTIRTAWEVKVLMDCYQMNEAVALQSLT